MATFLQGMRFHRTPRPSHGVDEVETVFDGNRRVIHEVLIAPQWIQNVSWPDNTISVNLTRQAV